MWSPAVHPKQGPKVTTDMLVTGGLASSSYPATVSSTGSWLAGTPPLLFSHWLISPFCVNTVDLPINISRLPHLGSVALHPLLCPIPLYTSSSLVTPLFNKPFFGWLPGQQQLVASTLSPDPRCVAANLHPSLTKPYSFSQGYWPQCQSIKRSCSCQLDFCTNSL